MESIQRESNLFGLVRRVSCVKQWHILSGASLIASRTRPIESVEWTLDCFQYPIRENGLSSHTVAMSFLRQFSNCSLQLLESKCDRMCSNTSVSENILSPNSVIFEFGRLMQRVLLEVFFLPTDAQEFCFKRNIKICIKIYFYISFNISFKAKLLCISW